MKKQDKKQSIKIAGFTLDQTILVVAVIAILATIIISSVAWSVLSKANATKIAAHLTQIGDAIGNYYRDNDHQWPETAQDLKAYLGSYAKSGSNDLITPFGTSSNPAVLSIDTVSKNTGKSLSTGNICSGGEIDCYIVLKISNMPVEDLKEANESIDGSYGTDNVKRTEGRLRWATSSNGLAEAEYYAVKRY